jgi:hypothetical protein
LDRSSKERHIQLFDSLEELCSGCPEVRQDFLPVVRVVMGFVGLSIVQIGGRELIAAQNIVFHPCQPEWFEIDEMAGVFLGGPLFFRSPDQELVRRGRQYLLQPGWSTPQPCANIRKQIHRK